ncbi:hypothetical protein [Nesterenkonia sp. PF2B19]|uniref:hypothetical protein n=1 Tax=Nesterenkonia sp. PF2B19 TaxID=1881858 RepID=UPI0008722F16|nr:hypothetical protein [Nesterenkonia sp. PF2B19]OSM43477.1 hypothetical protein BCY76_008135 [Nesterenkonia sp. PF2B19]
MPELFIPQPADWINANQREHWAPRARRTKEWRRTAGLMARTARIGPYQRIHVTAHVHKKTRHAYDAHNLVPTLKAVMDGLVDAQVIPDDTNAHLTGPDPREGDARPHAPGITLTITQEETWTSH